ncbi:MAG: hypothetical protein ACKORL_04055, partial [Phycisphaerales bacterium]
MGADVILTVVVLALVALVCAAGVGVTWWALFGGKSHGRRRCPRCGLVTKESRVSRVRISPSCSGRAVKWPAIPID